MFEFTDCKPHAGGLVRTSIIDSTGRNQKKPSKDKKYKSFLHKRFVLTYCCTYNKEHDAFFDLLVTENQIIKIGQYPSISDFIRPKTKKISSILGEQYEKELNTAIYLATHGVGIGSFIYLRRILENLIFETFKEAHAKGEITEDDFNYIEYNDGEERKKKKRKFVEKIEILKNYLPNYLVKKKQIYGIVSKGVHQLTEEACMNYYPIIINGILLILNQKLKIEEEAKMKKEIDKGINKIIQSENTQK